MLVFQIDNLESLQELGDLVVSVNVNDVNSSHLNEILKQRPHLLKQFSKAQKVIMFQEVGTGTNWLQYTFNMLQICVVEVNQRVAKLRGWPLAPLMLS